MLGSSRNLKEVVLSVLMRKDEIMDYLPKGRLDAFADGVFAIVITLLVLDLAVPEGSTDIVAGLLQEWFVFLAYLISFAFIGSLWISHSSVTRLMKQETTHSYRLTLLMLFFVSLLPFTTKLMATYLGHPPDVPELIYGLDIMSATRTLNATSWVSRISSELNPWVCITSSSEAEIEGILELSDSIVISND